MRAAHRLKIVGAVAAIAVLSVLAAPAGAQSGENYSDVLTMTLSATSTRQCDNEDITVRVEGLQAGSTASFEFRSDPVDLGDATADAEGVASLVFNIPPGTELGEHEVVVTGTNLHGQPETAIVILDVVSCADDPGEPGGPGDDGDGGGVGPGRDGDGGPLARTGTDLGMPLRVAVVAIAAGAALLLMGRKRQGRTA